MTFQEKNIMASLSVFTIILLFFLLRLFQLNQNGNFAEPKIFTLWGIVIGLAILGTISLTILTHIISAVIEIIQTGNEDHEIDDTTDERDDLIDLRGTKVTYTITSFGSLIAMLTYAFGQPPLIMFTLLILSGVIAQIAGDINRLRLYRRGF
ncbi:MAG: hypothetical protein AAF490_17325 [Chloroflexota bacterium]